jgi:hypothetical protein
MHKQVAADFEAIDKQIKAILSERQKLGEVAKAMGVRATKANLPAEFVVDGLVKGYMAFIKKTDGLTSASPSCTSTLSAAEKSPSEKTFAAAVAALKKQADQVKAAAAKDAGADKAIVKKFLAGMDDVMAQLQAASKTIAKVD